MVERIIEFSARNKFIVLVLTAVAVVMAVYAMKNVPRMPFRIFRIRR